MKLLRQRASADNAIVEDIITNLGVNEELATLLAMRGLDKDTAKDFLCPDISKLTPVFEYNGMRMASERIMQAISNEEKIVIYGDYDCDGVCASAILYLALRHLGAEVGFYVPNRKKEGYGINREALEEIAERYYSDLLVTVDCGISSKDDIEYAMDVLGMDVIVTDHHEPPAELPNCIIIDAKVERRENVFNELCGAGVALRLCEALGGTQLMSMFLDLACIATIGDIVPLVGDNRIIVSYGLKILNAKARLSTKLLFESAGITNEASVTSTDIAFKIVPRINAIGRLSDPTKAVEMFIDNDYFYVKSLVEQANEFNKERQQYTDDLVDDALKKLEGYDLDANRAIVLYDARWEAGVLGIACSRLVNIFHRPVVLMTLTDDGYKGSARSIEGVNLYDSLKATASFLTSYGGHSMACGLAIEVVNVEGFVFAINEYLRSYPKELFLPQYVYDIELELGEYSLELLDEIAKLEPFGTANPMPSVLTRGVGNAFTQIGETKHIKSYVNDKFEYIYFGEYANISRYNASDNKSIIAECSNRIYANRKYTQALVKDIIIDDYDVIDEDYLAVKYLYQAKYEDSSVFKLQHISEEKAIALATNKMYGVCYLAFTKATFDRYIDILGDNIVYSTVNSLPSENPYNSLILDMNINQKLQYYKKIVLLDMPIAIGLIDYLCLNINAEVFVVDDCTHRDNYIARVRDKFPSYDEMRAMYRDIRVIIEQGKSQSIAQLYQAYKEKFKGDLIQFYIAIYVFFELKIVKVKKVFYIDNTIKTSLESSIIYTKIREVVND